MLPVIKVNREEHNEISLGIIKTEWAAGWMHETSAWTWCTGKTQRDRVEREVGGGIGMGNICKSTANSCKFMTKKHYNIVK